MQTTLKVKSMSSSTPGKLRLSMVAIFVLAACFALAGYFAVSGARSAVNTIARNAVPSIVTAQTVRVKLLELDALASQEFLAGGAASGAQARLKYEAVRHELGAQLTLAARNISFGKEEQTPIEALMEKVQVYTGMVEAARANNRQGYPVGAAYLRMASTMLHDEMLPQTQAVDELNVKQLENEYASFKSASLMHIAAILACGLALLAVLTYVQFFLSKNMRRTFNLPLLAASAAVILLTAYSVIGMSMQRGNLSAAREGSFVSAYNWLEARGIAYDTKTDQSLYLIALGAGAKYETSARAKVEKLAPMSVSLAKVDTAMDSKANFKGILADEIASKAAGSTEQHEALSALNALRAYLDQDVRIHDFDKSGKRAQAVNLALGNGDSAAQQAFDNFNQVLSGNLKKSTDSFEASVASAESDIRLLDVAFIIIALLVAALSYFGLTPRINEYRV